MDRASQPFGRISCRARLPAANVVLANARIKRNIFLVCISILRALAERLHLTSEAMPKVVAMNADILCVIGGYLQLDDLKSLFKVFPHRYINRLGVMRGICTTNLTKSPFSVNRDEWSVFTKSQFRACLYSMKACQIPTIYHEVNYIDFLEYLQTADWHSLKLWRHVMVKVC